MAKNINTQDLVNELDDAVESSKDLLKVLSKTSDVITDLAKVLKKAFEGVDRSSSKGLAEFNQLLKDTNKLTVEQEKLNKEIAKTERELIKNEAELSKIRITDQKVLAEQEKVEQQRLKTAVAARKEQERLAKQTEKTLKERMQLASAYFRESKRLNELRKRYKDLVVGQGKTSKESRKLKREIDRLDKTLKKVDADAGQFQRNVGNYPKTLADALDSVKGLAAGLAGLGAAVAGVTSALKDNEEGSEDLRKVASGLGAAWNTTKNTLATAALETFNLSKKLIDNASDVNGLSKAVDNIRNGYGKTGEKLSTFTDDVEKNVEANIKATQQTIDLEKALRPLNERVAVLNGEFEKQNAIAGDSTRTFDEIEQAALKAARVSLERSRINVSVAEEELKIINDLLAARDKGSQNAELLNQQSEARIKLTEAQNAIDLEQIETQKVISENTRDRFERELDFAIDAFDTIKSINERIIADESTAIDVRRSLQDENERISKKAFESQKKLFAEFVDDRIDFDALVKENDEAAIRRTLARLDLDDVELGRALEVIRERKLVIQDEIELNKELVKSEQEVFDTKERINIQEATLRDQSIKSLKDFEESIKEEEIRAAIRRRDATTANSLERFQAQAELNDLLLEQRRELLEEEERLDDEKDKKDKERLEKRKELIEESINFIENAIQKASDKRIAQIDKELATNQARIQQINTAIEQGNQEANASLAVEEKRTRELEREKERQRKKAQQAEAAIAILRVFGENADEPNALGKTISDSTALLAFINSIPAFFEGTEDTGSVAGGLDSNGGRLSVLHDNERVMTAKQNSKMGSISNEELSDLGQMYNKGYLSPKMLGARHDNHELLQEVKEMTKAVKSMPIPSYNYDANGKYHEQVLQSRNKIERIKIKAKNIYS